MSAGVAKRRREEMEEEEMEEEEMEEEQMEEEMEEEVVVMVVVVVVVEEARTSVSTPPMGRLSMVAGESIAAARKDGGRWPRTEFGCSDGNARVGCLCDDVLVYRWT